MTLFLSHALSSLHVWPPVTQTWLTWILPRPLQTRINTVRSIYLAPCWLPGQSILPSFFFFLTTGDGCLCRGEIKRQSSRNLASLILNILLLSQTENNTTIIAQNVKFQLRTCWTVVFSLLILAFGNYFCPVFICGLVNNEELEIKMDALLEHYLIWHVSECVSAYVPSWSLSCRRYRGLWRTLHLPGSSSLVTSIRSV